MGRPNRLELCRLCLKRTNYHFNIFAPSKGGFLIYEMINYVYDLHIYVGDCLPEFVCHKCFKHVKEKESWKRLVQSTEMELMRIKLKKEAEARLRGE